MKKEYIKIPINDLIPYENNPRKNDNAVPYVSESIKQVGYITPIIVDENNVILAGHTRLKGLLSQNWMGDLDVLRVSGLTEEEKKKFRILDNKTGEFAEWDFSKLEEELENLDFGDFDFNFDFNDNSDFGDGENDTEDHSKDFDKYSTNVKIPQYEPTGRKVSFDEMVNCKKTELLIDHIEKSNVTEEEKAFLIKAAQRHNVFTYKNIAEYYANATPEMQRLMEESALVIIDIKDAIANGYAVLTERLNNLVSGGDED